MTSQKSQNSNMLLAFLTLLGVIVLVAVVGFFMLRKGPEIIQGQAEVTEYRVSSKVPGRILEFRVKEGQTVQAGDTLAILEAPDVMAKICSPYGTCRYRSGSFLLGKCTGERCGSGYFLRAEQ